MTEREPWPAVRARIEAAAGDHVAYVRATPIDDLKRLVWDGPHRRNVFGLFEHVTLKDWAEAICAELGRRAMKGAA